MSRDHRIFNEIKYSMPFPVRPNRKLTSPNRSEMHEKMDRNSGKQRQSLLYLFIVHV